jgi:hypothetical protein
MSTLTLLKAEIADDLARDDLTTAIANSISKAIRYYQPKHYYFNETRDKTFTTVADQTWYTVSDDADIPLFTDIDFMHITIGTTRYTLEHRDIEIFELLTDGNASSGQPYNYTYYNKSIGLFVPPDDAYTVRFVGAFMTPEPATDGETDNPWMVEAYDLIRSRATADIAGRKLRDMTLMQINKAMENDELNRIEAETASRVKTDRVTPTDF